MRDLLRHWGDDTQHCSYLRCLASHQSLDTIRSHISSCLSSSEQSHRRKLQPATRVAHTTWTLLPILRRALWDWRSRTILNWSKRSVSSPPSASAWCWRRARRQSNCRIIALSTSSRSLTRRFFVGEFERHSLCNISASLFARLTALLFRCFYGANYRLHRFTGHFHPGASHRFHVPRRSATLETTAKECSLHDDNLMDT